jgi:hypothetical protein
MEKDNPPSKSLSNEHERILKEVLDDTYVTPNYNKYFALFFSVGVIFGLSNLYTDIVAGEYDLNFVANLASLLLDACLVVVFMHRDERS